MKCGHGLEWRTVDGTLRQACPACNFVHWGDFSIGVGALVLRDGALLLVRRKQDPGKGLWTNPGGYAEQAEPLSETVVREVYEETGIRAMAREIVAVRDLTRSVHNLYVVFAMDYVEGTATPDGVEVDDAGFFTPQQMADMPVAGLTRWLVDVAWSREGPGLRPDHHEHVNAQHNELYRSWQRDYPE
ncbi:MAG: NUDIX hydrolase [Firmicutes bacterium]|nr:NUDIX hydrolase [Bacillota bacterium]